MWRMLRARSAQEAEFCCVLGRERVKTQRKVCQVDVTAARSDAEELRLAVVSVLWGEATGLALLAQLGYQGNVALTAAQVV